MARNRTSVLVRMSAELKHRLAEEVTARNSNLNDVAVSLSDGVFNLTLLKFPTDEMAGDERGKDFVGVHHFGFVVDDIEVTGKEIEKNGGRYHPIDTNQMATETKYRDPDGIVFDITGPAHLWAGVKL